MGYRRITYLVYGISMDYNDYRKRYDDDTENDEDGRPLDINQKYIENDTEHANLSVIKDDVSGDYVVIGKVIDEANITDGNAMSFTPIEIVDGEHIFVVNELKEQFGLTDYELGTDLKPQFYVFTHYS